MSNIKFASARELLEYLGTKGFEARPPIDVDAIAKMLGIKIIYAADENNPHTIGKIEFDHDTPVVTINPYENSYGPRRRFTLAHEIAHYCMHSNKTSGFVDTRKEMSRSGAYWDEYESEANTFAAQLLMPKTLVIKGAAKLIENYKLENNNEKIPQDYFLSHMSSLFEVSSSAMEYRLKNMGIL
jgi:Zn-dependent peptidase ImmA (M78 family)